MLVILDRDGVINKDSPDYIKSPDEWIPIEGSLEAIAQLNAHGHSVVVATNQSGIGRGLFNHTTLRAIHRKMTCALEQVGGHLDGIFYCPHHPNDGCACRKPKPGLLYQIAHVFQTNFSDAVLIGDSLRDIQAAQAVDCRAILVRSSEKSAAAEQALNGAVPVISALDEFNPNTIFNH